MFTCDRLAAVFWLAPPSSLSAIPAYGTHFTAKATLIWMIGTMRGSHSNPNLTYRAMRARPCQVGGKRVREQRRLKLEPAASNRIAAGARGARCVTCAVEANAFSSQPFVSSRHRMSAKCKVSPRNSEHRPPVRLPRLSPYKIFTQASLH